MNNVFKREENEKGNVVYKRTTPKVPLIRKSLAIFLASLQGQPIVIEFKDDSEIAGVLEQVDSNMNCTLVGAKQTFSDGRTVELEEAFVNGPSMRYVHFAPHINPKKHLDSYMRTVEQIKHRSKPHQIVNRDNKRTFDNVTSSDASVGDKHSRSNDISSASKEIYMSHGNYSEEEDEPGTESDSTNTENPGLS